MPPLFASAFRAFTIVILEFVAFLFFYNHPQGRRAVYFSWYAGIIDTLAILSGSIIMGASIYALHHPSLFTSPVPTGIFWLIFLVGSWQGTIHAVKIVIRTIRRL